MKKTQNILIITLTAGVTFSTTNVLAEEAVIQADEIIVTGEKQGYQTVKSAGLKTDVPLLDTPQSVSVITEEQIQDQAIQDISDITRYTPGLSISQGEGHRDAIVIRGLRSTADFFVDGVRDDVQYFRPLYNLDRVEVHKGPNAMIFGRGSGAGNINRVTKTPILNDRFASINSTGDTFGAYQFTADGNTYISDNAAIRVNMLAEGFENHRDFFDGERYAFNPTIAAKLGKNTRAQFSYEYIDDDRVVDRGIPSFNGEPAPGFYETFFGSPSANYTTLEAHILRGRIFHDFNENHQVNATIQYSDFDKIYQNLFANNPFDFANNQVELSGYRDTTERENFIAQINFLSNVETAGMKHQLLYGFEYADQETQNARNNVDFGGGAATSTFIFSDPLSIPGFSFPNVNRNRDSDLTVASLYIQDQITVTDYFQIIAGARYDQFDLNVNDIAANLEIGRIDKKLSPRLGFIFKPQEDVSIYASYSESFLPRSGEQFLTLSTTNANLAPQVFENYEFGVKWDILNALSFTSSIFRLNLDNDTTVDPSDATSNIRISSQIEGLELQLVGQVTPQWQINAGYSYLDAKENGRLIGGVEQNRTLREVPQNMFSIWNRYDFTSSFGLGLGLIYQDEQFTEIDNDTVLPSFTRVDAAAYYTVTDNIRLQLNIENLFDEEYFPASHNDDNISTGEPINGRLSLRIDF